MTQTDSSETDWGQCAKNTFNSLLLLKLNIEIEPLQQILWRIFHLSLWYLINAAPKLRKTASVDLGTPKLIATVCN